MMLAMSCQSTISVSTASKADSTEEHEVPFPFSTGLGISDKPETSNALVKSPRADKRSSQRERICTSLSEREKYTTIKRIVREAGAELVPVLR